MKTYNLILVFVVLKKDVEQDKLKSTMDDAKDYFCLNKTTWILYTSTSINKWMERLDPLVRDEGSLFISKLDLSEREGWMTRGFWKWLKEKEAK